MLSLAFGEIVIQYGIELAVKAILRRCLNSGIQNEYALNSVKSRVQALEDANLVSDKTAGDIQSKLQGFVSEVQQGLDSVDQNLMLISHLLELPERQLGWASVLLVLHNATRSKKIQNARIFLNEEYEDDLEAGEESNLVFAAMSFSGSDIDDVNKYTKQIATVSRKASRDRKIQCEVEILPSADQNERDANVCSVVFELLMTAFEKLETGCMTYVLGGTFVSEGEMTVLNPGARSQISISVEKIDGFVVEMQKTKSNFESNVETVGPSKKAYDLVEESFLEQFKKLKELKDVYFIGAAGEGKSTLLNTLMNKNVSRVSNIGVGTTRITPHILHHKGNTLRLWDLPGGDDANGMDAFNIEKLRCHLRNEHRVSAVILVNQKGRELRHSERKFLGLYKDLFGENLGSIMSVVIGRDENDLVTGNLVNTKHMKRNMIEQLDSLDITINPNQILFIRSVAIGKELGPPRGTNTRLGVLKDQIASRTPIFTSFAYWMHSQLLRISELRDMNAKSTMLSELSKENRKYVDGFLSGLDMNRNANLCQKQNGFVLEYSEFCRWFWNRNQSVSFRIEITRDDPGICAKVKGSYSGKRFGVVLIKSQLCRMFNDLRDETNEQNSLFLLETNSGIDHSRNGYLVWKEYVIVRPLAGISDLTTRKVRTMIDKIMESTSKII